MSTTNAVGEQSWENCRVSIDELVGRCRRETDWILFAIECAESVQKVIETRVDQIAL